MKMKSLKAYGLTAVTALLLAGCSANEAGPASSPSLSSSPTASVGSPSPSPSSSASSPASSPSASASSTPGDSVSKQVAAMTLEEKIGQMILAGFEGNRTLDAETKSMLANHHVGGIILYANNVGTVSQALGLINELKAVNRSNSDIPLFVSIDQEGGKVSRLPKDYKAIPANAKVGATGKEELAERMGGLIAREIKSLGFNVDFAPVLDINSNPNNPVIGPRSFGASADLVTRLGLAEIRGLSQGGVVSVVKHFPGHGDTSTDSHLDLPVLDKTSEELNKLEWIPFKAAIKQKVDAVMIAHILFPKIDAKAPASFSSVIIGDQLRGQMGYKGVVITDDLTMGAIMKHYDLADVAVSSVKAGSDILLVAHGYDNEAKVYNALLSSVKDGKLSEFRINESVTRILTLKQRYQLSDAKTPAPKLSGINNDIEAWLNDLNKATKASGE